MTTPALAARIAVPRASGLLTGKGKPFTAGPVARVRDAYKIWAPRIVAIQDGEVSVKHAAVQLGIPASAVYNWLVKGQVPARRAPGGRWCIPWDPATQEIYRDKVAKSFRLKPTNLAANGDPGSDATHRDNYGR